MQEVCLKEIHSKLTELWLFDVFKGILDRWLVNLLIGLDLPQYILSIVIILGNYVIRRIFNKV